MQVHHDMTSCYIVRPDETGVDYEFLQLRRRTGDFMGGTWQPVAGRIEAGETAVQAALREVREEAGLIPVEFYSLDTVDIFYVPSADAVWHCIQFCAIVDRDHPVVLNEEHDAFRWVSASETEEKFMWPGDHRAIATIRKQIFENSLAKPFMRIALEPKNL
jgi:dATP pyrophosphohydrolase